jgi:hypothetical protein
MASRFCKGKSITGRLGNASAAFKMNQTAISLKDAEKTPNVLGRNTFELKSKLFCVNVIPNYSRIFDVLVYFARARILPGD